MYKALNNSTYRRGPRTDTHTHTQKKMDPVGLYSVEPGRGYLPASCGHTDSKPPRWDSNPQPKVRVPRTRPSHHDRRPLEPRPPLFGHHHHGEPPQRTADRLNHDHHCLPSSRFYHLSLEVRAISAFPLASRLDEGLSGDSWPPLIGRAEHSIWLRRSQP